MALKAYQIAFEIGAIPNQNIASGHLKKAYSILGNYKEAFRFADIYISTKDSMFSDDKTKALAEMGTKYESEKKQLLIENLEKDNKLQIEENKKQKIVIYSFVLGFLIILFFSILLYRMFIQKKKANILLEQKNTEIHQQKEEIIAQRDEIEAQRDLVIQQKGHIEEIYQEVTDSINYAKRIQEAVLPVSEISRSILGEHFILFRPKDVVSGDFYWMAKIEKHTIIAVADCTGHGVPGAFMSMLGISFLNEIVRKKENTQAGHVLNELRKEIINALQQTGESGSQKDGMDMSLLVINKLSDSLDSYHAQWAGANNPLWIIRPVIAMEERLKQSLIGSADCFADARNDVGCLELIELKPDKMPIAIHERMEDFTNHDIELRKGDCLYLMSDGYQDQFGGPNHKKFLSKNLKQLLINNSQLAMEEQKNVLERTLANWIGDGEQIDDITVLGLRL
jgi:serine phosphatase RsbU (regulator of sigma subunit)